MLAGALPLAPADLEALIRLWEREAALSGSALLLDCDDLDPADAARAAAVGQFADRTTAPLIVTGRGRWPAGQRAALVWEVPRPTPSEQRALWMRSLGEAGNELNGRLDAVTSQFNLSAPLIHAAAAQALAAVASRGGGPESGADARASELGVALWDACRSHARPRLDDLATHLPAAAAWEDLILPEAQRGVLRDMVAHVRQRARVYEAWGFAARGARGLGVSALFAGASGTGKTLAAEVLAGELRLDLYRIDLSQVVSKYIGETEKNLRRVFDAAEEGGAVLLFDEADALFGKRSEVKDSHDRYANIEVSYLLQRMEAYRGLAILTTNMKSALDPAFLRRLRFVVQFPFPDAEQRAQIWRRVFPAQTPTDRLDVHKLAQLNATGGTIRNVALQAAFLAAESGEPVRMAHLVRAARTEYAKLERPLSDTEIAGWA
jgi:hypothetical protein